MIIHSGETMILILIVLSSLIFIPGQLPAQAISSSSGTASMLLLRSDLSPRASALSGAFTAIADDEIAVQYNPAGLTNIKTSAFGLSYASWFENVRLSNLLLTYKFDYRLGWALSIGHMGMPDIQGKDAQGNPTSKLQVSSSYIHLGLGYRIARSFNLGLGVKYFRDQLAEYSADGLALDFGAYLHTGLSGLTIGMALQNVASRYQYDLAKENLPMVFRSGIAYRSSYLKNLIVDLDLVKASDLDWHVLLGAEYTYEKLITLRLGNRFYQQDLFRPSIGLGLNISGQYQLDYAFSMHEELGATHRIGFTFRLPPPRLFETRPTNPEIPAALPLRPPSWVKFRLKADEIEIYWETVPKAQYNLYAKLVGETKWKKVNPHLLYANRFRFKKMRKIKTISFAVKSVMESKESVFSKEVTIELK